MFTTRIKYASILAFLAGLLVVQPVFANSRAWSFTMSPRSRVVDGKANGVFHTMDAGTLTLSGNLWVHSTLVNPTGPASVTVAVRQHKKWWFDSTVCSQRVTPSKTVGSHHKVSINKNCGKIGSGTYYLVISRGYEDGREIRGSGQISTR